MHFVIQLTFTHTLSVPGNGWVAYARRVESGWSCLRRPAPFGPSRMVAALTNMLALHRKSGLPSSVPAGIHELERA